LRISHGWSGAKTEIEFDYGIVLLPDPQLYRQCGHLVLDTRRQTFFTGHAAKESTDFFIAGFPSDKAFKSMWLGRGRLRNAGEFSLRHLIDTMPGQSGGPLFTIVRDPATGGNAAAVLAIHSRPNLEGNYNEARLLDERAIAEIQGWVDEARQLARAPEPLQ
jgi:V8-like Glu-specific endopeptidase